MRLKCVFNSVRWVILGLVCHAKLILPLSVSDPYFPPFSEFITNSACCTNTRRAKYDYFEYFS